jgi:hypothetical protein
MSSFIVAFGLLFLAAKLFGGTRFAILALVAHFAGMLIGALFGAVAGFVFATKLNRKLDWI